MRELILTILVKVRSCGRFLVTAKRVTQFMMLIMDLGQMNIETKLKFTPKGTSNNYKSLHFLQ